MGDLMKMCEIAASLSGSKRRKVDSESPENASSAAPASPADPSKKVEDFETGFSIFSFEDFSEEIITPLKGEEKEASSLRLILTPLSSVPATLTPSSPAPSGILAPLSSVPATLTPLSAASSGILTPLSAASSGILAPLSSAPASLTPLSAASSGVLTPSEAEIEEFFAAAEKYEQKRFSEKYNYDVVKDVPMEGRYQWVKL